jgi:hypothetical protein
MKITAGDMCIRGSYPPDHFVLARCQRWVQGDTKHRPPHPRRRTRVGSLPPSLLTHKRCVANLASVIRWIARAVTIFALCCAIGLQWLALQSIAWTAMIVDYSKQDSICRAIAKTLDGAHPCSLCHIVDRGKTAEKKSDVQLLTSKIDMICTKRAITLVRLVAYVDYVIGDFSVFQIGDSPPVPPPRNSFSA